MNKIESLVLVKIKWILKETERVATFFAMFYASINAGSLISTFVSPLLRENVVCFDREDCFFVAFLVPCVLMFVSLIGKSQTYQSGML